MSYRWFIFILVATFALTLALAAWKAFAGMRDTGGEMRDGRYPFRDASFISRLSWGWVPWPLLLALAYFGLPWVRLLIYSPW